MEEGGKAEASEMAVLRMVGSMTLGGGELGFQGATLLPSGRRWWVGRSEPPSSLSPGRAEGQPRGASLVCGVWAALVAEGDIRAARERKEV